MCEISSPTFTRASETLPIYLLGKDGNFGTESTDVLFPSHMRESAAQV